MRDTIIGSEDCCVLVWFYFLGVEGEAKQNLS